MKARELAARYGNVTDEELQTMRRLVRDLAAILGAVANGDAV